MTDPLILPGPPAHTAARLDKTLRMVRRFDPSITAVYAETVYFLVCARAPVEEELANIERILTPGTDPFAKYHQSPAKGSLLGVVVPRDGTQSPWSSKATDIFRRCGLSVVRRVERGMRWYTTPRSKVAEVGQCLFDRMTEQLLEIEDDAFLEHEEPVPLEIIALGEKPDASLAAANESLGLALSEDEIDYLARAYADMRRDPTDVELMMFAQANSEHCRHKIFNASWRIDDEAKSQTLFGMIRNTHAAINGAGILSAYADNAAVIEGTAGAEFFSGSDRVYRSTRRNVHVLMKVETHNHPTAIAPYPGAATGSGGEIRDEGAVGRGSKPKAGLCGFTTSHLYLDGERQPWEQGPGTPGRIATALEIMLEGPIGAAAFNNEFGRPCLTGYFRTFEAPSKTAGTSWGYHKPVMIAGGVGTVADGHIHAAEVPVGAKLVVLGGPAFLIGLGGGAASSMASGTSSQDLDFASVQRDNAEMQRRCQEVIDHCRALGDANPILLIHDVGAGGLSNALPELVHDAGRGGLFDIRRVPSADPGLSPMELWCNESQERYVLAIDADALDTFGGICYRERCPFAVVGEATGDGLLRVVDSEFDNTPVDMPLATLLGKPPRMERDYQTAPRPAEAFDVDDIELADAIERVLRFPAVASKKFLITIGDRSITGLIARDQMVGAHQVPVADVAVTLAGFDTLTGEAMAMGERPPVAVIDPAAAARLAVAEALTNLHGAPVVDLSRVVLSANWMAAAGHPGEDQALRESVAAVGMELCPALGIAIPVGKDSLSMRTSWDEHTVLAPVTLNVTAFAPVQDAHRTLTPVIPPGTDALYLLTPEVESKARLGGSVLAQCHGALGDTPPDVDDPTALRRMLEFLGSLVRDGRITAYHDRSDGGLIVTLLEMAFATRYGKLTIEVGDGSPAQILAELFAEEVGVVIGIAPEHAAAIMAEASDLGLGLHRVASVTERDAQEQETFDASAPNTFGPDTLGEVEDLTSGTIEIAQGDHGLYRASRVYLERIWASTSHAMQRLRDDETCADEEYAAIGDDDLGLGYDLPFDPTQDIAAPYIAKGRPRVAILREQGVNGQLEMAAAFDRAGFECIDVHTSDLFATPDFLDEFQAMAVCGGFSFGDVLGAGGGWAKSILFHEPVREAFGRFFERDTLTLGVCNGCQMLAQLQSLIPGAEHWPTFLENRSERFEARTVQVRINAVDSPWLQGMAGARLPVPVAHGEGRANSFEHVSQLGLVAMQYVDGHGEVAARYPTNPNGSEGALAGLISESGNVLAMMPHPERVFRNVQNSHVWHPEAEDGPWLRIFRNARVALG